MSKDQVVLVTGASSGLGQAIAQRLVREGYTVFGTFQPSVPYHCAEYETLPLELTDQASIDGCVDTLLARAGRVDILINNAGCSALAASEETSPELVEKIFAINVLGTVHLINRVLPVMRRQRHGRIINITSVTGCVGMSLFSAYSASKHALEGYTEALRMEVRRFGIHVSIVAPGHLDTPLVHNIFAPDRPLPEYAAHREHVRAQSYKLQGSAPQGVASLVLRVLRSESPRLRYAAGMDSQFMFWAKRWLPTALVEWALSRAYPTDLTSDPSAAAKSS